LFFLAKSQDRIKIPYCAACAGVLIRWDFYYSHHIYFEEVSDPSFVDTL
jgi:hypothetical protein